MAEKTDSKTSNNLNPSTLQTTCKNADPPPRTIDLLMLKGPPTLPQNIPSTDRDYITIHQQLTSQDIWRQQEWSKCTKKSCRDQSIRLYRLQYNQLQNCFQKSYQDFRNKQIMSMADNFKKNNNNINNINNNFSAMGQQQWINKNSMGRYSNARSNGRKLVKKSCDICSRGIFIGNKFSTCHYCRKSYHQSCLRMHAGVENFTKIWFCSNHCRNSAPPIKLKPEKSSPPIKPHHIWTNPSKLWVKLEQFFDPNILLRSWEFFERPFPLSFMSKFPPPHSEIYIAIQATLTRKKSLETNFDGQTFAPSHSKLNIATRNLCAEGSVDSKSDPFSYLTMRSLRIDHAIKKGFLIPAGEGYVLPPQKYLSVSKNGGFKPILKSEGMYDYRVSSEIEMVSSNKSSEGGEIESEIWLLEEELRWQQRTNSEFRAEIKSRISLDDASKMGREEVGQSREWREVCRMLESTAKGAGSKRQRRVSGEGRGGKRKKSGSRRDSNGQDDLSNLMNGG